MDSARFPPGLLLDSGFFSGDPLVNVYIANWKNPPFSMGKSTISMVIFNSYVLTLPEATTFFSGSTHFPKVPNVPIMSPSSHVSQRLR